MLQQNLSTEEEQFSAFLATQGSKVEIAGDKSFVIIDGQNRGTFDDTKSVFAAEWASAQNLVQRTNAKQSGVLFNGVTCPATNVDMQTVANTTSMMNYDSGLTNIPVRFSNGQVLTLADQAALTSFLGVWVPFRLSAAEGFSVDPES